MHHQLLNGLLEASRGRRLGDFECSQWQVDLVHVGLRQRELHQDGTRSVCEQDGGQEG